MNLDLVNWGTIIWRYILTATIALVGVLISIRVDRSHSMGLVDLTYGIDSVRRAR